MSVSKVESASSATSAAAIAPAKSARIPLASNASGPRTASTRKPTSDFTLLGTCWLGAMIESSLLVRETDEKTSDQAQSGTGSAAGKRAIDHSPSSKSNVRGSATCRPYQRETPLRRSQSMTDQSPSCEVSDNRREDWITVLFFTSGKHTTAHRGA